jgi:nucleolar pre-ribosomal-associated protein 1
MHFPAFRAIEGSGESLTALPGEEQIYDPIFVILLLGQVVSSCPPSSALSWVQLFRTNAVSLVIRCLSSKDSSLRKLAFVQLGALYKLMQVRKSSIASSLRIEKSL